MIIICIIIVGGAGDDGDDIGGNSNTFDRLHIRIHTNRIQL